MLEAKNISVKYSEKVILENLSLKLVEGSFTTLLGQNGSGKSTLMRILSGNERPKSGKVTFDSESSVSNDFTRCDSIFLVNEAIDLYLPYDFYTFVSAYKSTFQKWDDRYFKRLIQKSKIDIRKNFNSFSRGQKMQLMLSVALACGAETLLLDEITSVLDVHARKFFLDELKESVGKGKTVLMTTNIINELEFYTDRIVVLRDSKIVLNSDVDVLNLNFKKLRIPSGSDFQETKEMVWAGMNSDKSVSYIVKNDFFEKAGIDDQFMDRRHSTLEDVFIYYFADMDTNA